MNSYNSTMTKKKKKKLWAEPSKGTKWEGKTVEKVPLEPHVFVGILHLSLKEMHLAALKPPSGARSRS